MGFDRYKLGMPANYPEVKVQVWCNPNEDDYLALKMQQASSPELVELWNRAAAGQRRLEEITERTAELSTQGDLTPEQEAEAERLTAEVQTLTAEVKEMTAAAEAEQQRLRLVYGALLARAYAHTRFDAYGFTFDFSTAEAALATVESKELPLDLRRWFRLAPAGAVEAELEEMMDGGLKKSFQPRTTPGK